MIACLVTRWLPTMRICAVLLGLLPISALGQGATPSTPAVAVAAPGQPASGPGGADYAYQHVAATAFEQPVPYWVFTPALESAGTPAAVGTFPIVLFLGGCCPDDVSSGPPDPYLEWIDHLVRRGAVVVYPTYRGKSALADAQAAVRAVVNGSGLGTPVAADPARLAVFGTSSGGALAASYAANAANSGLPVPAVLLTHAPIADIATVPEGNILPSSAYALVIVSGDDEFAAEALRDAAHVWTGLAALPPDNRNYIMLVSDNHGEPPLIADHFVAVTGTFEGFPTIGTDALDWYGTWKLLDGLMACAFTGEWCEYALGGTPEQRFMGIWSDGVPVNEARVTDGPEPIGTPRAATPTA